MSERKTLDNRINEQNKKKNTPKIDNEPDDMELEETRQPLLALNRQRSVFDTDSGNSTSGINTAPSVFEKTAVFRSTEGGPQ